MFALGNFRALNFPNTFSLSGSNPFPDWPGTTSSNNKSVSSACAPKYGNRGKYAGNMLGQNSQIRKNYWNPVGIVKIPGAPIWKTWGIWLGVCQNFLAQTLYSGQNSYRVMINKSPHIILKNPKTGIVPFFYGVERSVGSDYPKKLAQKRWQTRPDVISTMSCVVSKISTWSSFQVRSVATY